MNHSTLQIFIQVADTQSVTLAAKRLGRAQSNITTRIQQLEEELAVELFVRGNKKMVLSPAGVQFLSYARRILSLAEEAKQSLHPTTPGGSLLPFHSSSFTFAEPLDLVQKLGTLV